MVETQPATIAEFGSPQTGPQRGTKPAPPGCSGSAQALLKRCTASAQGKAATAQGGGPNWSWEKKLMSDYSGNRGKVDFEAEKGSGKLCFPRVLVIIAMDAALTCHSLR